MVFTDGLQDYLLLQRQLIFGRLWVLLSQLVVLAQLQIRYGWLLTGEHICILSLGGAHFCIFCQLIGSLLVISFLALSNF